LGSSGLGKCLKVKTSFDSGPHGKTALYILTTYGSSNGFCC
jgi:hypothetical protein